MAKKYISPKKIINKAIKKWWLFFLFAVLGGAIGFLISMVQTPRYEAVARISTSIDYTISPKIEDYQEDRVIQDTGLLMISDDVLEAVRSNLADNGIAITHQEMIDSFTMERIDDLWTLRVTNFNPKLAEEMANVWMDEAYLQLDTAFQHAQTANSITVYIDSLERCLYADAEEAENYALCAVSSTDAITTEILKKTDLLKSELNLGRTINPSLRYSIISYAQTPNEPVFHTRGILILSNILLGVLAACTVIVIISGKEKTKG